MMCAKGSFRDEKNQKNVKWKRRCSQKR